MFPGSRRHASAPARSKGRRRIRAPPFVVIGHQRGGPPPIGRIIVEQIVSADGYAAEADGGIGFFGSSGELRDPDMEDEQMRMMASVGAIAFGRTTYRMFEAYWPGMSPRVERVAAPINALPKYVVSSTLATAPWGAGDAVAILRGHGVAAMRALRTRIDGDIVVWGSLTLADALLRAGEADLLRLRMLPALDAARPFPSGAVLLAYRPR